MGVASTLRNVNFLLQQGMGPHSDDRVADNTLNRREDVHRAFDLRVFHVPRNRRRFAGFGQSRTRRLSSGTGQARGFRCNFIRPGWLHSAYHAVRTIHADCDLSLMFLSRML
jgi:hypothetical protein